MADLAVEYLREIENRTLSDDDRKAIPLERARCLLDAAEEEPDEGARTSMIGEAKEAFNDFLAKNPSHPRASEAALALARLTSMQAKAQLNRARRLEIPPPPSQDAPDRGEKEKERDGALAKQREEAKKAQPLFLQASRRFAEAAKQMKLRLEDKSIAPFTRQTLAREVFDAELAAAVNHYHLADTVVAANTAATEERVKYLEEARKGFAKLADGSPTSRTVWVARAWMAETLMDQSRPNEAGPEFDAILKSSLVEADDGRRLVKFFQLRRAYLAAVQSKSTTELAKIETALHAWLNQYAKSYRPTPETVAAQYYRAFALQFMAELSLPPAPKDGRPQVIPATARNQFAEAETIYRALSHTDNDYTQRATRNRMFIVRKMLGDADRPVASYTTFETAQLASLIQIAKLGDAERALGPASARCQELLRSDGHPLAIIGAELRLRKTQAEVAERKIRIVALLEHARSLVTPQENPNDVADNLLRLVYFYQSSDEPSRAAVLGEHIARSVRTARGKSAAAGLMALNGYAGASARIKVDRRDPSRIDEAEAAAASMRKADRQRAVELARFLDKAFPNDIATDAARHQLAALLVQDRLLDQAFEAVIRVRAGYAQLTHARDLEGYIAVQILTAAKDTPLPPGGKLAVFARAAADLDRVVRPSPDAGEDEVRGYITVRVRLGSLYLAQAHTADQPEARLASYDRALAVADEIMAALPSFEVLLQTGAATGELNLDGQELRLLALDLHTRSIFLRGRALVDAGPAKTRTALAAIQPTIVDVGRTKSLMTEKMKQWAGGQGDPGDSEEVIAQKAKVAGLTSGVDKWRCDTVMLGFKLAVKEGKPDEAAKMLGLLKAAGGSVADNQSTYELMARELAAPIAGLRREKKDAEAKAMGDGVALLLKELAAVQNQPPSSTLFIGQTLYTVERYDAALTALAKIKPPSRPDWATMDLDKIANGQERNNLRAEIRDYRFAQLYTAKALRGANKIAEAEKLLGGIIGDSAKHGWGYSSYDFRRELALLFEAKAAGISAVSEANPVWLQALKEWTTLFHVAQLRVKNLPPNADPEQVREARSGYFDAFYEIQRVMISANSQLQKDKPQLLAKSLDSVGKKIADMERTNRIAEQEKAGQSIINAEVWNHYVDLLDHYPAVKDSYKANGGVIFLERRTI